MRILIDMNLSPRWAGFFGTNSLPAVHWNSVADPQARDETILDWCLEHRHILLTNDLDFARILALSRNPGPSVILVRGSPLSPESRGEAVLGALHGCREELGRGAILTLSPGDNPRLRLLPLP